MSTDPIGAPIRLVEAGRGADPLRANTAHHVGDDPGLVADRRAALVAELGRPIVWMNQTHSARIALVRRRAEGVVVEVEGVERSFDPTDASALVEADGVVVDARDWPGAPAAAVMTADCLPVLLSTAGGTIVAAVHAGRRGLFASILTAAVARIASLAPGIPIDAYIAPAICGRCYEVPGAMRDECAAERPESASITSWGTPALDLAESARVELLAAGCRWVAVDPRCTFEDPALHSYRRDSRCGRSAAIVSPR